MKGIVKPSYRYRLNRLAEQLVEDRSECLPFTDEEWTGWNELWSQAAEQVERTVELRPGVRHTFATKEAADAFNAQKIRDHARVLNQTECPEGNPNCENVDKPVGYGYHFRCNAAVRFSTDERDHLETLPGAEAAENISWKHA